MPWYSWISIGIFMIAAELFGVEAAFYLIFIGVAAVVVGLLGLAGITMVGWAQYLLFGVLALSSMYFFRHRLYMRFRGNVGGFEIKVVGEKVKLEESLQPGKRTRVTLNGSIWTAENDGDSDMEEGEVVDIVKTTGLVLKVRKANSTEQQEAE